MRGLISRVSNLGQPADCGAKLIRDLRHVRFIPVFLTRPEEALQTVLSPPRNHVDVEMWHTLAHAVVHGYEGPFRPQPFFHRPRQKLGIGAMETESSKTIPASSLPWTSSQNLH